MPSSEAFRAPKGTRDVLAPESARWEALLATFAATVEAAGYGLIVSPMFEDIGVFKRLGEGTDVVTKEMYDFLDKGDRHVALRPEGTASVVRAYVQHQPASPWKVWYATPAFRYENVHLVPVMYLFLPGSEAYVQAANGFLADQLLFGSSYTFRPIRQSIEDAQRQGNLFEERAA